MAAAAPAVEPVALSYVNPRTGAPPLPTMGCECQWLRPGETTPADRKSTRLNSSHSQISYAVFCLKKKSTLARPPHQTQKRPVGLIDDRSNRTLAMPAS